MTSENIIRSLSNLLVTLTFGALIVFAITKFSTQLAQITKNNAVTTCLASSSQEITDSKTNQKLPILCPIFIDVVWPIRVTQPPGNKDL